MGRETRIRTGPAGDGDCCAVGDAGNCGAIESKFAALAGFCLELLTSDCDLAIRA